jgi:hypothetical protein
VLRAVSAIVCTSENDVLACVRALSIILDVRGRTVFDWHGSDE